MSAMTTRPRLLIVEDESDTATALQELLEGRGYDVRIAGTAAIARASHADWEPNLVLLDLMLPDASGLELLREAATRRANKGPQAALTPAPDHMDDPMSHAVADYRKGGGQSASNTALPRITAPGGLAV